MSIHVFSLLAMIGTLATGALASFQASLDLIVRHHGRNETSLAHTVDTLTHIATKLKEEPEDQKYRSIRLLNKTFWERVGSVNGGISFMSALGFDLVEQGEPHRRVLQTFYHHNNMSWLFTATSSITTVQAG